MGTRFIFILDWFEQPFSQQRKLKFMFCNLKKKLELYSENATVEKSHYLCILFTNLFDITN